MSPRAIRRAAERKALKLAAKATKFRTASASAGGHDNDNNNDVELPPVADLEQPSSEHRDISDAKLAANRQNALRSTGPRTPEGREKSSKNAVKTGLTGQTVVLPSDDVEAYQAHVNSHYARYFPMTEEENTLVQLIADSEWRILRIAPLEAAIYEVARIEIGGTLFPEEPDPVRRAALINGKITMLYEKQLKNLHLQERHLRKQHKSDIARLENIQEERDAKPIREAKQLIEENKELVKRATKIADECKIYKIVFNPAEFGFDFSLAEWNHYRQLQSIHFILSREFLDIRKVVADYRNAQGKEK